MTGTRPLLRAWLWLVAFGVATSLVAALAGTGRWHPALAAVVLALAGLKAVQILRHYLGLAAVPNWRRGFETVIGLYLVLLFGLYLVPLL
jgi:uncharacterized membrane protein YjjP (DUF1212 family)